MPEPVRIIGHTDTGDSNEGLQLQVYPDGSIAVRSGGYQGSDIDETADPAYYGSVDKDGRWKIISITVAGAIRYVAGTSNYLTAWTNRASQTYDYYYNIF